MVRTLSSETDANTPFRRNDAGGPARNTNNEREGAWSAADIQPGTRARFTDRSCRYVHEACGGDQALGDDVERLLGAYFGVGDSLLTPAMSAVTIDEAQFSAGPGSVIGRYKLLQRIGEGGMGVVYMAEQTTPLRRRVALKIIKPGMDSSQVIARFEAERQALAMMDHPNIAKVLDAGTTDSGLPYFVMELVNGVRSPILRQSPAHSPRRFELVELVCHAVQHAHQKGIIHRDIKPSNVLVSLYDGKPAAQGDRLRSGQGDRTTADRADFLPVGAIVGTLEYMSPEQAESGAHRCRYAHRHLLAGSLAVRALDRDNASGPGSN